MFSKGKGLVYKLTMATGAGIVGLQFGGEVYYAQNMKEDQDLKEKAVSKESF